jgi:hypothetical protein
VPAQPTAASGALGGASNEAGAEFRARVGALLATAVIRHEPLSVVGLRGVDSGAVLLHVESDDPVDDLVVHLGSGNRVYFQAKLRTTLRDTPGSQLSAAVAQFARAVRAGLRAGDRIVLATARPSAPIRALGPYLERRRLAAHGALTQKERQALSDFRALAARHASAEEVDAILDHLTIWPTDPTAGDGEGLLAARLDGHVAAVGEGPRAMRELSDEVRRLARARGGMDAVQLVQALAARGVPLADDAPVTSPVAWATALAAYRLRAVRRGTTLELFGAPAELRGLPLSDVDANVGVDVPGLSSNIGRPLVPALRRRGRALLIGSAGGGKSTALRAVAAHWAAEPLWPVPIDVHLQRIASSSLPPLDAILENATSHLPVGGGREALRRALGHELGQGRCLVLLDGLDEVRRGRRALVGELSSLLDDLDESNEIIVSVRPVAAGDADELGLPELRLLPPRRPMVTVAAILDAARPAGTPDSWVASRRAWVKGALDRDGALARTPLTVVVLTLIAVRAQDASDLPTERATVLRRALVDVVDQWEVGRRQRDDVTIGRLEGAQAKEALTRALLVLSTCAMAADPPSRADVLADLGTALAADFDLRPGEVRAAATDAVRFWEEIGLFDLGDGTPAARIRPFAELGNAWGPALDGTPDPALWVRETRAVTDLWASLALGAGLSTSVADAWARAVAEGGGADEVMALVDAVGDGAAVTSSVLVAVVDAAVARLLARDDAERVAEALVALPLGPDVRARIRPQLTEQVPDERRALVDAMIIVRWNEHDETADDRLRTFVAAPAPPRPQHLDEPEVDDGILVFPRPDDTYRSTFALAAVRVARLSRADAERVVDRFEDGTIELRSALRKALREQGHHDLARRVDDDLAVARRRRAELFSTEDRDATRRHLLGLVAALAPPSVLTQTEVRRLDALCELAHTAAFAWLRPELERKHPGTAACWVEAVARLGGFDLGVLAAQASVVLAEPDADELLDDEARERRVEGWDAVADPETMVAGLVDAIGKLPRKAASTLAAAIATSPIPWRAVALLETIIPRRSIWAKELAARVLLMTAANNPDKGVEIGDGCARRWLDGDDPFLRSAAATWWAWRARVAPEELERCLQDRDAGVRLIAVRYLDREQLTPELRERMERLVDEPPRPWTCDVCGEENADGTKQSCAECHTTCPDVAEAVRALLGVPTRHGWSGVAAAGPRRIRRRDLF